MPSIIRKSPIRYETSCGKIKNKTPKIMATMPKTGREIVMPILRRLLSTTSVKNGSSTRNVPNWIFKIA